MRITEIEKADLAELSFLYQQLIPNEVSIEKMESVYDKNKTNNNHIVLVAKESGRLIGTLLASICEMYFGQCKSFMVIEDFVVDVDFRGKGIGSALISEAENKAKDNNCSYIMLITDSDRMMSQNFYKKLGYSSEEYCAFKKKI